MVALRNNESMGSVRLLPLLGVALYVPAIHILVAEFSLRNMDWLREKALPSSKARSFEAWTKTMETDPFELLKRVLKEDEQEEKGSGASEMSLTERLRSPRKKGM